MSAPDIAGWIGSFLILLAYFLVSTKRVAGDSGLFQLINFVGALLLIWLAVVHDAWPLAFLDIVWAGIALVAIAAIVRERKRKQSS